MNRIVIIGAGESGTGAALLAKAKGYDVFLSENHNIRESFKAEMQEAKIEFEEGVHSMEKILNADLVIKSPGVPDKEDVIQQIKKKGIEIIDEIEFGFRFLKGKVIAISGTNGKTTTTLLTYHLLKEAGLDVALAGNVGESLARKLVIRDYDWYVIEVSSYQLDGTTTFKPDIAVLLNITPDHLDRYDYKFELYIDSKFRLLANMEPADQLIYYKEDAVLEKEMANRKVSPSFNTVSLKGDNVSQAYFDGVEMNFRIGRTTFSIKQEETTLKGPHNLINTMAAVSAACFAGINEGTIRRSLKNFKNAPHRLESVAKINNVEFINDSKATNVDSVIYALGSYSNPLIWIAGGVDKGNDYDLIREQVKEKVKALICLGVDNDKLKNYFSGIVPTILETQSVKELVRMALKNADEGDVVLLSPACASFDLFKNYIDRGDQFREAVLELKVETETIAS
ncbi:MAG TPA: UDP-N-acetylmuramoyl-L-alanine--D-glutamate ligase [Cyclobacteriaceae bacterium]|nr:UDP-N-acetylmuramoyl-L-alanine--D-glutamate ligase [Cyclobacteriaceae bacterium]